MHNIAMFDWNDLRHFLAVAREGSTLAAARKLRVNQSTVHRRLAALEKALGCSLVERHMPSASRKASAHFSVTSQHPIEE
jgi:DNA-binding transcriptional LysR family regulator